MARKGQPAVDDDPDSGGGHAPVRNTSKPTGNVPNVKEAEPHVQLTVFPEPHALRAWKASLRQEVATASRRPDPAFSWHQAVEWKELGLSPAPANTNP